MNRLEDRIRTGLHETAERIPDAASVTAAQRRRSPRPTGVWVAAMAVAAVLVLFTPFLLFDGPDQASPPGGQSPFLGTWVSIDADLSIPTMEIGVSADGVAEMVVVDEDLDDDFASVCSGASSTITGTGQLRGDTQLVFPSPVLTCDDGSQPRSFNGIPVEERLQNLTFTYRPESDTLIDSFGERWTREGVGATFHPMIRWPQASWEEVREAQEFADAGDPDFTWQLEPNMESLEPGEVPELFVRAVQKRFGWEEVAVIGLSGEMESEGIRALGFQLVRCEPGQSNPLRPNDRVLGNCASTIEDSLYETVEIFVAQPDRQGPEGIWVVSSWPSESSVMPHEGDPNTDNGMAEPRDSSDPSPDRTTPPTDAEITELMNEFVGARVRGEGAQQYLHDSEDGIPLLYATSSGAPYDRGQFEQVSGIDWPYGQIAFSVRLFAGDTVVEQLFFTSVAGPPRLEYQPDGYGTAIAPTTEDGRPVALSQNLFDGEVILQFAHPWTFVEYAYVPFARLIPQGPGVGPTTDGGQRQDWDELWLVADPTVGGTGCAAASPGDAEALAGTILSYPGLEASSPLAVSVDGADALMMDVAFAAGTPIEVAVDEGYNPSCANELLNPILDRGDGSSMTVVTEGVMRGQATGERMRLYLINMPEGSSLRTIAIAIAASESRFERAVNAAAPVVDSIRFRVP